MKSLILGIFLLLIAFASVSSESTNEYRYKGEGKSLIFNNDIKSAKKEAMHEAFKEVIQKGVGVYIKTKSEVKDYQVTYSKILSESEGYIENFNILSERTDDGVYIVSIEANVSNDKIDQAFSKRIAKFIENNLVGPCSIELWVNGKEDIRIGFYGIINDPTIEMSTIEIKLPNSGWIKPKIISLGTINTLSIEKPGSSSRIFLKDVILLLENPATEVRLKNPGNDQLEIRKLFFDKFNNFKISDHNTDLLESAYLKPFKDFNESEMKQIISILKKFD